MIYLISITLVFLGLALVLTARRARDYEWQKSTTPWPYAEVWSLVHKETGRRNEMRLTRGALDDVWTAFDRGRLIGEYATYDQAKKAADDAL